MGREPVPSLSQTLWPVVLPLVAVVWAAGCGGVREDRTIAWSSDGRSVAFQHGRSGVFVADPQTGEVKRIYTPPEDVLATGSPLWSPGGRECVFTTAVADELDDDVVQPGAGDRPAAAREPDWDDAPDGRLFWPRPVSYTCWLYQGSQADPAEPAALFTARCDHPGYVGANLAVRWHPFERRLLFIDRIGPTQHAVFEYDLETGAGRRLLPGAADALVCEWSPDGRRVACAVARAGDGGTLYELSIGGDPGDADPWQVRVAAEPCERQARFALERLRLLQPVWTADGERFACVAPGNASQTGERWRLLHGDAAARMLEVWLETDEVLGDLRWSPLCC